MDQWRSKFSESFGLDRYWSIERASLGQGPRNPGKTSISAREIHDPKMRTSTSPRDFQKLRSERFWAEFLFPIVGCSVRGFNSADLLTIVGSLDAQIVSDFKPKGPRHTKNSTRSEVATL